MIQEVSRNSRYFHRTWKHKTMENTESVWFKCTHENKHTPWWHYGCLENFFVCLCLTFNQTNPDTNKPIISVSTTATLSWSEFTFIQMWFLWLCNLFSSAQRDSRKCNHKGFARPWEKEYIQTWKNWVFLHTSLAPSSPGWRRQEMGMTASCLSRLWRQATRYDVMAERCSCPFTRLFVMCDLLLPHCCFICDLVFPDQMAISCLTCPLYSCRTVCGKKKWHRRA